MKMKKWLKSLLMTLAFLMVVNTGAAVTTVPAVAKAKAEAVKKGTNFWKGNYQYKVTSLKGKKGTAALIGAKSKVTSVSVPETVSAGGYKLTVTAIGSNAFKNCKKLETVVTNKAIKEIGKNAFKGCKSLTTVDIRSKALKKVGKNALTGISAKAVITVPDGKDTSYEKLLKISVQTPPEAVAETTVPEAEEAPKAEETQKVTETPKTEETQKATEAPKTEETQKAAEAPKTEETQKAAEVAETEETQKAAEVAETEETQKAETAETEEIQEAETSKAEEAQETEAPKTEKIQEAETSKAEEVQETEAPEISETQETSDIPAVNASDEDNSADEATPAPAPEVKVPEVTSKPAPEVKVPEVTPKPAPKAKAPAAKAAPEKPVCGEKHLNLIVVESVAPTCTKAGTSSYEYCTVCGYRTEPLPITAIGHSFGDWTVARKATCTEAGTEERTCAACGEKETRTTAATGHTFGEWTLEPIPTSACYAINVRECTSCGYKEKGGYPVHRTDVLTELEDIAPTCTTPGATHRTSCEFCGAEFYSYVKPLGHDYSDERFTDEGTCIKAGISYRKCTRCGAKTDVRETTKAEGHQWEELKVPATCTESGFTGKQCSICGEREGRTTNPLGHTYVTTITEATCEEAGTKKVSCSVCGDTKITTIPATGKHQWVSYAKEEATCIRAGHSEYTQCSVCGEYKDNAPTTYAPTKEHRWVTANNVPYSFASVASVASVSNDAQGQEPSILTPAERPDGMTYFYKRQCEDCGAYKVVPGSGYKGEDDSIDCGHVFWVVFLSKNPWAATNGYSNNYACRVEWKGETYHCYVLSRRGCDEDVGLENWLKSFKPPVPMGKPNCQWKDALVDSDLRSVDGDGYFSKFEIGDLGKTFIAQ